MLIKPDLNDEAIITCLQDTYGLEVATISFLPLGADFNTAVYRLRTNNQIDYFLKLGRRVFIKATVTAPKFLADLGSSSLPPVIRIGQLCAVFRLWVDELLYHFYLKC